jgi:hypothetical protein
MDEETSNCFEIHRAPNGKFYITRDKEMIALTPPQANRRSKLILAPAGASDHVP